MSHPMWVRGLKPKFSTPKGDNVESHPMWVRGLKHVKHCKSIIKFVVAPHVGAWIETLVVLVLRLTLLTSHPMWVRGLKLSVHVQTEH